MERKQCADCGEASLESEPRCWACGGFRFAADDVRLAGEPTICLGSARDATVSWKRERTLPMPQLYVLCATACAFFTWVVGYWIGRASAPAVPPTNPTRQQAAMTPQTLPLPPTSLSQPAAVAPMPSYYDPAVVTVRQKPTPGSAAVPGAGTVRPLAGGSAMAAQPAGPVVLQNPNLRSRQNPLVVTQDLSKPLAGAVPPVTLESPIQIMPLPSPGMAVVMLRNNASGAVELEIDGDEDWTVTVAAGSSVPVTLTPGSYHLRAEGDGARSKRSTLALGANRRYSLVIDRKQESGREALVLMEPAVDGVGG